MVGDFAGAGGLGGFFVQEEDADADTDPQTSEGIFVASARAGGRGRRRPRARHGRRELRPHAARHGHPRRGLPRRGRRRTTTQVQLPVASLADWEPLEGMAVTFPQDLTISEYFDFDRFNETVLSVGRQITPTAVVEPGSPRRPRSRGQNLRGRIMLDDGRNTENPDPGDPPGRRRLRPVATASAAVTRSRASPACSTSPSATTASSRRRPPSTPRSTSGRPSRRTSAATSRSRRSTS